MQKGDLFLSEYYQNDKLIKITELKFIGETEECLIFEPLDSGNVRIEVVKSCYPEHLWNISPNIRAKTIIKTKAQSQ